MSLIPLHGPCHGNGPTARSQPQKRPFIPCPGHLCAPGISEAPPTACAVLLPAVCAQERQRRAGRAGIPPWSSAASPVHSLPLNNAPRNPSEVLLPIHAPQELCSPLNPSSHLQIT